MKRLLALLTVLLTTLSAFAQGDSPYARFGYEGKVLRTPQERQQRMMLVVPNPDTTATVAKVGLDPAQQKYYLFDKQNQILVSDTLASTTVSRFLSTDPLTTQYPWLTPYQFASNTPIQSLDLDGREAYDYRLFLDANGHRLKGEFLGTNRGPLGNFNLPTLLGIHVFSIVVVQEGQPTNNYTFSLHDNEASQKYADKFLHDESFRRKWMNTEPTDAEKQTAVAKQIGDDVADGFTTAVAIRYGQSRSQSVATSKTVASSLSNTRNITSSSVEDITKHLSAPKFADGVVENSIMLQRLRAIAKGEMTATEIDVNFHAHEMREIQMMSQGMNYEEAHTAVLKEQGMYHRDYDHKLYTKEARDASEAAERAK